MLYRTSSLHFMGQQSSWAYTCFRARRLLKLVSSTETIEKKSSSWPRCKHLLTGRWESDTLPIQKGNILDRQINAPILPSHTPVRKLQLCTQTRSQWNLSLSFKYVSAIPPTPAAPSPISLTQPKSDHALIQLTDNVVRDPKLHLEHDAIRSCNRCTSGSDSTYLPVDAIQFSCLTESASTTYVLILC